MAQLLAAVPDYGGSIVFVVTFVACLGLPFPASLMLLAAGALAAAGRLQPSAVLAAAFGGALAGDLLGYAVGRWGGAGLWSRLEARPATARLAQRARDGLHARALSSVFLSRWLFSALAPWVNLAAGATVVDWRRFLLAGVAGRMIWVGVYVGLGLAFADQVGILGATMIPAVGALCAVAVAVFLGRFLWQRARDGRD